MGQVRPVTAQNPTVESGDAGKTIVALMKNMKEKIVHRDDIHQTLKTKFDQASIKNAIERLLMDGTIYTAHSNDTFILDE